MTRKSYFRERTLPEIQKLTQRRLDSQSGMLEQIIDLDPQHEAIIIDTTLTPDKYRTDVSDHRASRINLKHGNYRRVIQPKTQGVANACSDYASKLVRMSFNEFEDASQADVDAVGYCFDPVQGRDRLRRFVPFAFLAQGQQIFEYTFEEDAVAPIKHKAYADSERVFKEGTTVVAKVPSRSQKKCRYVVQLNSVPIKNSRAQRAAQWGVGGGYAAMTPNLHGTHNIRYTHLPDREGSQVHTLYPHAIAAYHQVAFDEQKNGNDITAKMSPFPMFTEKGMSLVDKLANNVTIVDSKKGKQRHLHLAEKSMMIAKAVSVAGVDYMFEEAGRQYDKWM